MSSTSDPMHLPDYHDFSLDISALSLPISAGLLHGMMCGYLCAQKPLQAENYIRALANNKKDERSKHAVLTMFQIFFISQQQLQHFDFDFQLLIPDDDETLMHRAEAFSDWCEGFTQALGLSGVTIRQLVDEESQDALHHLNEFAQMDHSKLDVDEEDERALMEVIEYSRMAVLRLYNDLNAHKKDNEGNTTH